MDLDATFHARERLCPMPAGPALLDGSRWTVRLAQGDASIEAPRKLLERVATACDGMSSVADIVEGTRPPSLRGRLAGMIDDLLEAGVLVDASLFPVAAQRFAWVPSPFGVSADKSDWIKVPMRFDLASAQETSEPGAVVVETPLDELLDARRSIRTYDSRPLDESALVSYLWLLGGVVAPAADRRLGPHRTMPSGGATYAVRPLLVLRAAVGAWTPGVYAVEYPAARQVRLRLLHDDVAWLPRATLHPWFLSFAAGMVFLVADPRLGAIKYRARAVQYVFIEAGAALQNVGLAADRLGMAMTPYGGYVESVAIEGLRLDPHDMIVASTLFGAKPTVEQMRIDAATPPPEFEWVDAPSSRYAVPFHLGRSALTSNGAISDSWGRDADPWIAYRKTHIEALERHSFRSPKEVELARLGDWQDALDPRDVIRYAEVQYRDRRFGLKRFDEQAVCGWVAGQNLATRRTTHVLAEQVYAANALRSHLESAWAGYTEANTSGCAAHLDAATTLESALFELIERDAYSRSWLLQQPGSALSPSSLPAAYRQRFRALESAGCRVWIQQLPSRWAPVCVAYAQHEALHFTVVGAGARASLVEALQAALDEVETLAYANLNDPKEGTLAPRDVRSSADHAELYTSARYFRCADALLRPTRKTSFAKASAASDFSGPVSRRMIDGGCDIVVVDITAPHSAVDQGRTPVTVLRALVPGLVPITFGHNREPLGSLPSYHRGGRFPHPFP